MNLLLLLHIALCCFMTGAIWLVQIILYPLFSIVSEGDFSKIHQFHMKRITPIVAPVMFLELVTALGLLARSPERFYFGNLISVAVLWVLTAFVNVPTHNKLRFDSPDSKRNLVLLNWPRTVIWSLRSLVLLAFLISPSLQEVL